MKNKENNFSIAVKIIDLDGKERQFATKQKALEYIRTLKFSKPISDAMILKFLSLKITDLRKWNMLIDIFMNDKNKFKDGVRQYNLDIVKLMLDKYKDYFIQQPIELTKDGKEGACLTTALFTCYPYLFGYDKQKFIDFVKTLKYKSNIDNVSEAFSREFGIKFVTEKFNANDDGYINNIQKLIDVNNSPVLFAFHNLDNTRRGHAVTLLGYDNTDLYYYDNSENITEILLFNSLRYLSETNKQLLINNGFSECLKYFKNYEKFTNKEIEKCYNYIIHKLFKRYHNTEIHCVNKKLFKICTEGIYTVHMEQNTDYHFAQFDELTEQLRDINKKLQT